MKGIRAMVTFGLSVCIGIVGGAVLFMFNPTIIVAYYYIWALIGILIFSGFQIPERVDGNLANTTLNPLFVITGLILSGPLFWVYGAITIGMWFFIALVTKESMF